MNIGLYAKVLKDEFDPQVRHLVDLLKEGGAEVMIFDRCEADFNKRLNGKYKLETFEDREVNQLDVLISIGGDGTILSTVDIIKDSQVPVLGINSGRLGFLSTIGIEDIDEAIPNLLQHKYSLDKRSLIQVSTDASNEFEFPYALNEVTVHKKDTSSMVTIQAWMNDSFISSYWADGLIVSTPTGSTAYSLSCGGPIAMPNSENFVITPIAPHNLNVRPLVVSNNENTIRLKSVGRETEILLTLDSKSYTIADGSNIYLKKAHFYLNLVRMPDQDFFSTIRNKLMWGMDKRN